MPVVAREVEVKALHTGHVLGGSLSTLNTLLGSVGNGAEGGIVITAAALVRVRTNFIEMLDNREHVSPGGHGDESATGFVRSRLVDIKFALTSLHEVNNIIHGLLGGVGFGVSDHDFDMTLAVSLGLLGAKASIRFRTIPANTEFQIGALVDKIDLVLL